MSFAMPPVVVYEDRPAAFAGVELLARSLAKHAPDTAFIIYSPTPEPAVRLAELPMVQWRETLDLGGRGWSVKPTILLRTLKDHETALWLDTDIIVAGDLEHLLRRFPREVLVVGQEFHVNGLHGGRKRAEAHGLHAVRSLPYHVNSGSIRASRRHQPLLEAWSALLASENYQAAQRLPLSIRPATHLGDQDLLWALLISSDFSDIPVDYLRTGIDMLQHCGANGYHLRDRFAVLGGARPAFVHMLGHFKPWSFVEVPSIVRKPSDYLNLVCYELGPFFTAARPYAKALDSPPWLRRRTWAAILLNVVFFGNTALQGMPLAVGAWILANLQRWLGR